MTTLTDAFESLHRADPTREHALLLDADGRVVAERAGTFDEVAFSAQELRRASGGSLTHNHPQALPVSAADLALAAYYGLTLRAVGQTESGSAVNYVVKMPTPDAALTDRITSQYAAELRRAEQELATAPLDDRTWQRESRHRAVARLAKRLGFGYQVEQETRRADNKARLDGLATVDPLLSRDVFTPLVVSLVHSLTRNASASGLVPLERLGIVRREKDRLVQHAFFGKPHQDGTLTPYSVQGGLVVPNSAYAATLWTLMQMAAAAAIERHAALMRKHLPDDLRRQFEYATVSPFDDSVHEMDSDEQPPLTYDPLHRWLGPDGKTLSDRIWSTAGDMRAKLDAYLTQAIARATPVTDMARELKAFLIEGQGGYAALRLARTETAAAYHRADFIAAQGNPFVETYSPFVAPGHTCCDGCDIEEANGPYPKSDMSHMPTFHPNCLCGVIWNEVSDPQKVIIRLRQKIEQAVAAARRAITDTIGPLSKKMLDLLFRGRP